MNHGRYAVGDDDHALLARFVEDAANETLAALGPLEGLVLGGSLARGEGTVWRGFGGPVALSDLDLAAVVRGKAERARATAPHVREGIERRLAARGLLGGFDLGVYAPEDLARQGPRPGTLEYRRSGRVLVGRADLTAGFPALEEQDVPPEEALVLLENRGAELLLAWPGESGGPDPSGSTASWQALAALYAGMKTVLDGAFALVVQSGSCPASVKARQAALESWTTVEGRSETLRAVLPDFLEDVRFWGAMKLAPDPAAIALRLGVADSADVTALGRRAWREGARAWTACYRIVASRQFGVSANTRLEHLAAHAAHRARPRRRLRRWLETARAHAALERAGRARWALRPGAERIELALRGAPEHELAACVALLLGAWTDPTGALDFRPPLARLFPGVQPERLDWDRCRRAAVLLWGTFAEES
jgi:hypothetical protein